MYVSYIVSWLDYRSFWSISMSGVEIYLGFTTVLHHAIARNQSFGIYELKPLETWLKNEYGTVYDIGGYNGLYGLLYAKKYSNSQVVIFEPDEKNYAQIVHNIKLNQLKNCTVEMVAISDKEGYLFFSQNGTSKEHIVSSGGKSIKTFPLSHYPQADFIKIDVEGAEGKIFDGLKYKTQVILELHDDAYLKRYEETRESITKKVRDMGFSMLLLEDRESEQHWLLKN